MLKRNSEEVSKGLGLLEDLAFLETDLSRRRLTAYMTNYCESSIVNEEQKSLKVSYIDAICSFYKEILEGNFRLIGKV